MGFGQATYAFVACLVLIGGSGALARGDERAGLVWMSGDAIRGTFAGEHLQGVYPSGNRWTEQIKIGGKSDYREEARHWVGDWWVDGDAFCFRYPPPGLGGCFRIARVSTNCFELYGVTGAEGGAREPPVLADRWNGRMWLSRQATTCEQNPVS